MEDTRDMANEIGEIVRGYQRAQTLLTANAAGLFEVLEQPQTAAEAAASLGLDAKGTRMLLDALAVHGLVVKSGESYVNGATVSACLVKGRPGYQGHIVRHLGHGWDSWGRLGEFLKADAVRGDQKKERSAEELRDFILGMSDVGRLSAADMTSALDLSSYRSMLDVGGGPATYSIAFAQANPELKATVFDLPPVVEIAREEVERAGLGDRISFLAGDYDCDELGTGYDLVLISNIIHSLSAEKNEALVAKCGCALKPGGTLIVKDFLVDDERTGPAFSLLFALHMFVHTEDGDVYTVGDVRGWGQVAGLEEEDVVELTPQTRLWLGRKPG